MRIFLICATLASGSALAGDTYYFHLGGGLDSVNHDLSPTKQAGLNLKAGFGYRFTPTWALEADLTAETSSTVSGTYILNGSPVATGDFGVSRQYASLSGVYRPHFGGDRYYLKAGVASINAGYRNTVKPRAQAEQVLVDESGNFVAGLFQFGAIFGKRHRVGLIVSSEYGDDKVGKSQFTGIEYNYLFRH